jgi:hypothetical protein
MNKIVARERMKIGMSLMAEACEDLTCARCPFRPYCWTRKSDDSTMLPMEWLVEEEEETEE